MSMQASYIQGVTIQPSVTVEGAASAVFKFWPARSELAVNAAKALLASLKSSQTMGELSATDKTAAEISALEDIVRTGDAQGSGTIDLSADGNNVWSGKLDSSALYGVYEYVILSTDSDGVASAAESGTFTVTGNPGAAAVGGGIVNIHTRFC